MSPRTAPGFTLVELVIVVAIIGLMASLAIPNFLAAQMRARRAEVPISVDALRTAEVAYRAEWDTFTILDSWHPPLDSIGRTAQDLSPASRARFAAIGWVPDGAIWGSYNVARLEELDHASGAFIIGSSDVDGDLESSLYMARVTTPAWSELAHGVILATDNHVY